MRNYLLLHILFVFFFLHSCSSGTRDLKRGLYKDAVFKSIKQLRRRPENDKARHILKKAYKHMVDENINSISVATSKKDVYKWDEIVSRYRLLNRAYNELQKCPACLETVKPKNYIQELEYALNLGAKAHFAEGCRLLGLKTKQDAQMAHRNFLKTKEYDREFQDIDQKLRESFDLAVVRVLISPLPVGSRVLDLSSEFFNNQIRQEASRLNYRYVQFFSSNGLPKAEADEEILLKFDDYVVGQTYLREKIRTITKDSVQVGSIKLEDGTKKYVFGTVQADYHTFTKTVKSSGLLDYKRIDAHSQSIIEQRKFPGTFLWEHQWATFQGDRKALSNDEYQLTKISELNPPNPQELFFLFTQPIFDQLLRQIRHSYRPLKD